MSEFLAKLSRADVGEDLVDRRFTAKLYPSPAQRDALLLVLERNRELYNCALEHRKVAAGYQSYQIERRGRFVTRWRRVRILPGVSKYEQSRQLTAAIADLGWKGLATSSYRQTLQRLDAAYQRFFAGLKRGDNVGPPRFVGRDWRSFEVQYGSGVRMRWTGDQKGVVTLAGVGGIRFRGGREAERVSFVSFVRQDTDVWSLSYTVNTVEPWRGAGEGVVAIDLGVKTFATCADSTGRVWSVDLPSELSRLVDLRRKEQRSNRRRQRGSANYQKSVRRAAAYDARARNLRKEFHHVLSAYLAERYATLRTEDLSIQRMMARAPGKAHLNRLIGEQGWGQFLSLCEAKMRVEYVDTRAVAATQTCHSCGKRTRKPLSERRHRCTCGVECDRDVNAALVLLDSDGPCQGVLL